MPERRGNQNSLSRPAEGLSIVDFERARVSLQNASIPMTTVYTPFDGTTIPVPPQRKGFFARAREAAKPVPQTDKLKEEELATNIPRPTSRPKISVQPTKCCGFAYIHGLQLSVMRPKYLYEPDYQVRSNLLLEHPEECYYPMTPEMFTDQIRDFFSASGRFGTVAVVQAKIGELMSDAGDKWAAYIAEKDYGTVTRGPPTTNPNSLNEIVTFLWNPNENFMKTAGSDDDGDDDGDDDDF
jgi:hypothetical protein